MTTENYTLYTKDDPNGRFAVTASTITVSGLTRNEEARIYDNKGVAHFGDFTHDIDATATVLNVYPSAGYIWAVANSVGGFFDWWGVANALNIYFFYAGTPSIVIADSLEQTTDLGAIGVGTNYYLRITRLGATVQCFIYSDSGRTVLVDTISVATNAGQTYQFVYSPDTINTGQNNACSYELANLDLNEAVTTTTTTSTTTTSTTTTSTTTTTTTTTSVPTTTTTSTTTTTVPTTTTSTTTTSTTTTSTTTTSTTTVIPELILSISSVLSTDLSISSSLAENLTISSTLSQ